MATPAGSMRYSSCCHQAVNAAGSPDGEALALVGQLLGRGHHVVEHPFAALGGALHHHDAGVGHGGMEPAMTSAAPWRVRPRSSHLGETCSRSSVPDRMDVATRMLLLLCRNSSSSAESRSSGMRRAQNLGQVVVGEAHLVAEDDLLGAVVPGPRCRSAGRARTGRGPATGCTSGRDADLAGLEHHVAVPQPAPGSGAGPGSCGTAPFWMAPRPAHPGRARARLTRMKYRFSSRHIRVGQAHRQLLLVRR